MLKLQTGEIVPPTYSQNRKEKTKGKKHTSILTLKNQIIQIINLL